MTPAGTEPAAFRFVAQNLNHCATAVPSPEQNNVEMSVRVFSYLDRLCNHAAPTYECRLYQMELLSW